MRTLGYFIALLAGLLVWREARAEDTPSPKSRTRAATLGGDAACGAPFIKPCDGYETPSCENGRVVQSCCPAGAKCNYRFAPFVECGDGLCIPGDDPGQCVPRQPQVMEAADEADCKAKFGDWAPACISGEVKPACIAPVPTNYSGPGPNPVFRTCGTTACTTSQFIEDCFPVKSEGAACAVGWTKVCLQGRITERCLPPDTARSAASQGFAECGAGRCIIGPPERCPRTP